MHFEDHLTMAELSQIQGQPVWIENLETGSVCCELLQVTTFGWQGTHGKYKSCEYEITWIAFSQCPSHKRRNIFGVCF